MLGGVLDATELSMGMRLNPISRSTHCLCKATQRLAVISTSLSSTSQDNPLHKASLVQYAIMLFAQWQSDAAELQAHFRKSDSRHVMQQSHSCKSAYRFSGAAASHLAPFSNGAVPFRKFRSESCRTLVLFLQAEARDRRDRYADGTEVARINADQNR